VGTAPFLVDPATVGAAASDGTIRFWDAQSGEEKRKIETGAPYFNAPIVVGNMLYAADFAGFVRAIPIAVNV
jgi:WD40 repeat protein